MALRVEFHTGVVDDLGFACRLLRKACRQGARVLVRAPTARLQQLDRELWTFVERDFLPHLRFQAPGPVPPHAARTPIWLVDGEPPADCPPVLVNLGAPVVAEPERFARIIEIVSGDEDDLQAGRQRWRDYKRRGLPLKQHPSTHG